MFALFLFFNPPATTEIYTLSLHDALPISLTWARSTRRGRQSSATRSRCSVASTMSPGTPRTLQYTLVAPPRSEEHTSELQSRRDLVCRLLLEKKKKRERRVEECASRRR